MKTNALKQHLVQCGYKEMFGIGLWAKDEHGTVVDLNTGNAKVTPHIDAAADNYVGWAETVEELETLIETSNTSAFFVNERKELSNQHADCSLA